MKAAVLRAVGMPLTIEDVQIDEPRPLEVLIDVAAAGLCHSDLVFMTGGYPAEVPAVFGHESAGIVAATGAEVTHVSPGDHVITCLSVFCGKCEFCLSGRSNICIDRHATARAPGEPPRLSKLGRPLHQFLELGSFAQRMLVHENAVVQVTKEIPLDRAALLGCGVATGLGAVFNTAAVRPGQSVAVIGCGGVGLSAVQGARIAGAGRVIAIDRLGAKLDLAAELGATDVVDATTADPVEKVMSLTAGRGVDHAFEAVGLTATAEQAFALLARGGTATLIGLAPVGDRISLPAHAFMYERKMQGSVMGSNRFRIDVPRYVGMYLDGRLRLDEMVTERYALDDINRGFQRMRTGEPARNVVVF